MPDRTTKPCTRCGQVKPLPDFYRIARYADGYATWCKACWQAYRRERRARPGVADAERAYGREWHHSRLPEQKTADTLRRRAYDRERWHNNPGVRQRKNAQKARGARTAAHRLKRRVWSKAANHRRRVRVRDAGPSFTTQQWRALCEQYGHRCLCCGEHKPLTPDHVIPLSLGGSNTIDNIQPLCGPCNSRKFTKTTDYRPTPAAR